MHTTDRVAFIRDQLPQMLETPDVTVDAVSAESWDAMDLSELDKATGWTTTMVGDRVSDDPEDGFYMTVLFCPERIAMSVQDLPMSPDPTGPFLHIDPDAPAGSPDSFVPSFDRLMFADNYLRLIEYVVNQEILHAAPGRMADVHQTAIDSLDGLATGAGAMLATVMAAALDERLGR